PSLLAAIGEVIEKHMISIGFLKSPGTLNNEHPQAQVVAMGGSADTDGGNNSGGGLDKPSQRLRQCPKCGQPGLIRQEGCDSCINCDYSKCG
nr:ribonucleoside-diphosphate reductase, adenosylcobalamin-dependent [Rhodospirillaceae bacterium]